MIATALYVTFYVEGPVNNPNSPDDPVIIRNVAVWASVLYYFLTIYGGAEPLNVNGDEELF